jgi:hypothetical protein
MSSVTLGLLSPCPPNSLLSMPGHCFFSGINGQVLQGNPKTAILNHVNFQVAIDPGSIHLSFAWSHKHENICQPWRLFKSAGIYSIG